MEVFNYVNVDWETIEFMPGWVDFYIGNGIVLDILINMKGLEKYSFIDCLAASSLAKITHLQIPFLHINHLIENKKAVNSPKDKIDIIELEKIIATRKDMGFL